MALDLDKKTTALVVIDLQKGIASSGRTFAPHSTEVVVQNAAKLAEAFRKNGMPVFLVHVVSTPAERLDVVSDDPGWRPSGPLPADASDFVPEIGPKEGDLTIAKKQWGAFYGTELELQLRRRGMRTIVLCGISTNYGVESTARFAYRVRFPAGVRRRCDVLQLRGDASRRDQHRVQADRPHTDDGRDPRGPSIRVGCRNLRSGPGRSDGAGSHSPRARNLFRREV